MRFLLHLPQKFRRYRLRRAQQRAEWAEWKRDAQAARERARRQMIVRPPMALQPYRTPRVSSIPPTRNQRPEPGIVVFPAAPPIKKPRN